MGKARLLRQQATTETNVLLAAAIRALFTANARSAPVEAFADVRSGIQRTPGRAPGANPVRYLTVAHVQRDRIDLNDPRFFEVTVDELDRWRLLSDDVLIIEGNGSAEQIGRAALFRGEIEDCVHQNHVIRVRPDKTKMLPEFLNSFLNSAAGRDAVQTQSRTTSGLRTLSADRIKRLKVPVLDLIDQQQVVAAARRMQQDMTALRTIQNEAAEELAALLPALLCRAFA